MFDRPNKGEPLGGSLLNTSRPAPAMVLLLKASNKASNLARAGLNEYSKQGTFMKIVFIILMSNR
jgi:hypothetical protein